MRTNYVMIDFENVQPELVAGLEADHFRVCVFVGANQSKLSFDTAAALQRLGARAEYVKIAGNGPNALDFHIAFHVGRLSAQDPTAFFHIISKDTGFDPLIRHLKERKILAARVENVTDIAILKAGNAKSISERLDVVVGNLSQRKTGRPRTVKTLGSTINALFQKQLSDAEVAALVDGLRALGAIAVEGTQVNYLNQLANGASGDAAAATQPDATLANL